MSPDAGELPVSRLSARDAPALVACVRRCYGETHPEAGLYDVAALQDELARERLLSWVARDADRVVAHVGVRLPEDDRVAETVGGIVDPDYRGRRLIATLGLPMMRACAERGVAGLRMFATTAHTRTQTWIERAGGVATGVLLGHVPANVEYRGMARQRSALRTASVAYHQPTRVGPGLPGLVVHPPARHREWIGALYGRLGLARETAPGHGPPLRGVLRRDERRGALELRLGADEGHGLDALLREADPAELDVATADVELARPGAAATLERLRDAGFSYAALLVGGPRSERLRVQRVRRACMAPERAALGAPQAEAAMAHVLADAGLS